MAFCESRATPPGNERATRPVVPTSIRLDSRSASPPRRAGQVAQLDDLGAGHLDAAALGPVGEQRVALRLGGLGAVQGGVAIGLQPAHPAPRRLGAVVGVAGVAAGGGQLGPERVELAARPAAGLARPVELALQVVEALLQRRRARRESASPPARPPPAASRPVAAPLGVGARPRVLGVGDERRDPLLPPVVSAQPLDPDRIDELGQRPRGERGGGTASSPSMARRSRPSADVGSRGSRRNGFSAAGYASGGRSFWPSAAMATANSMAERSARCSSTAPPTAGATSLDIIPNVTGADGAGSTSSRRANTWSTNGCLTRTDVRGLMRRRGTAGSWGSARPAQLRRPRDPARRRHVLRPRPRDHGRRPHDDTITEVGAVKVRGGEFLGTFQTLVNPGRAIPPQITMLTGLTDALVAPAPRIEAVLPSLLEFLARHDPRRPQHRLRRGVPARRLRARPATRASTRCGSTRWRWPAGWCATRCRTAAWARWRRGSGSTTSRPTGRSTTPSPRPTCCTC